MADLSRARYELEEARRRLEALRSAEEFEEAIRAWYGVAGALERCWNKLGAALKDTNYSGWHEKAAFNKLRTCKGEVLAYIDATRDLKEHVDADGGEAAAGVTITGGPGGGTIHKGSISGDGERDISYSGYLLFQFDPHLRLCPVTTDKGTFPVPCQHQGKPIHENDPATVAETGIKLYEEYVERVSAKFGD